jgi:hypothetical protein
MKRSLLSIILLAILPVSCGRIQGDHTAPVISDVSTSNKVVVISDCPSTSATITANVTDESKITSVLLWVRVGTDKTFASTEMGWQNSVYTATVNGSDLQGHGYGVIEFYITAEDEAGNSSKSSVDRSIQFLPCVNN